MKVPTIKPTERIVMVECVDCAYTYGGTPDTIAKRAGQAARYHAATHKHLVLVHDTKSYDQRVLESSEPSMGGRYGAER